MANEPGADSEATAEPLSAGSSKEPAAPPSALPSGRRAEVLATLAIVGAFVIAAAARPVVRRLSAHPSREQCAKMLDRYAEEEARAADPARGEKGGSLDSAPARSIAASTLDRCTHDLTEEEVACALRSNGADELERCLDP